MSQELMNNQEGNNVGSNNNSMVNLGERIGSNVSESSYGEGSLCLSLKNRYKVINKSQLEKVEFPIIRVGTSNIDCGISFIEEISDMEDDYDESPYETRTKRERIRDRVLLIKDKYRNAVSKFRNGAMRVRTSLTNKGVFIPRLSKRYKSIRSSINKNIISKFRKSSSNNFSESMNGSNIASRDISRSSSILRSRTLSRLNFSKTSRMIIMKKKIAQKTNKVNYVLSSKGSYVSKRFMNCVTCIKSKMVYNYYKLRNIIGDKFPKRRSKFVLYFKKGSDNKVHKVINCEQTFNDNIIFENALIYDSVEYMSRNLIDDYTNEIDINNNIGSNYEEVVFENDCKDEVNNTSINVKARIEELNSLTKSIESSRTRFGGLYGKEVVSGLVENNQGSNLNNTRQYRFEENDQDVTPTTIDSFPRLASMDSTTCTTQNDSNGILVDSTAKLPVMIENINKMFEKVTSIHGQVEKLKLVGNKRLDDRETTSASDENIIFSSLKNFVDNMNSVKSNLQYKQTQYYYELLLTLVNQTHKYYENIIREKEKIDNDKIRESIFSLIEKLNEGYLFGGHEKNIDFNGCDNGIQV
ncbi:hypothetical protein FG379_002430 [Cryptosporidium bovis]|uniref:uncharacterized protein n=1 Tax=Cryptosporidium bovis TaxID=310047 RepID=UPI00351A2403|nr:hypothetical protein FG379_002430 [Cryptosporidium bovis]